MVMNVQVPTSAVNFLTILETIRFWRTPQPYQIP